MAEANMNNRFDFCSNGKVVYKGTQFTEYEDIEDAEEVVNPYGDLWGTVCGAVVQIVDVHPFMQILVQNTQYMGVTLINALFSALPVLLTPSGPAAGMIGRQALVLTGANANVSGALLTAGIPRVQVIDPNIVFAKRGSGGGSGKKYYRSKSERRKALLRDADDPNSGLTPKARKFIKDNNGNKVPDGYEVSHETPLYTKKTIEGKKEIDKEWNLKTIKKTIHKERHKVCGDQYHYFPKNN